MAISPPFILFDSRRGRRCLGGLVRSNSFASARLTLSLVVDCRAVRRHPCRDCCLRGDCGEDFTHVGTCPAVTQYRQESARLRNANRRIRNSANWLRASLANLSPLNRMRTALSFVRRFFIRAAAPLLSGLRSAKDATLSPIGALAIRKQTYRARSLFYMRHARPIAKAAGVGFDNQAFFIMGARRDQLVGAVITIANCSQDATMQAVYAPAEKKRSRGNRLTIWLLVGIPIVIALLVVVPVH